VRAGPGRRLHHRSSMSPRRHSRGEPGPVRRLPLSVALLHHHSPGAPGLRQPLRSEIQQPHRHNRGEHGLEQLPLSERRQPRSQRTGVPGPLLLQPSHWSPAASPKFGDRGTLKRLPPRLLPTAPGLALSHRTGALGRRALQRRRSSATQPSLPTTVSGQPQRALAERRIGQPLLRPGRSPRSPTGLPRSPTTGGH